LQEKRVCYCNRESRLQNKNYHFIWKRRAYISYVSVPDEARFHVTYLLYNQQRAAAVLFQLKITLPARTPYFETKVNIQRQRMYLCPPFSRALESIYHEAQDLTQKVFLKLRKRRERHDRYCCLITAQTMDYSILDVCWPSSKI
jgi:hypothetical protein